MKKLSVRLSGAILIVFGLIFFGAAAGWAEERSDPIAPEIIFNRLAVTPFLVGDRRPNMDETLDETLSCPLNQICADDSSIQSNAGPMMMRLVHAALKRRFGRYVVPLDQVQAAYSGIRLDGAKDSPLTMARRMGESLSADLMVVGTVWRYRDRGAIQGFPDKPASVAFALYIVDPNSGRKLWRGLFDEAQEIALNDLAKFTDRIKMGLKWLSADELARHGVKEIFRPFPDSIRPGPLAEGEAERVQ